MKRLFISFCVFNIISAVAHGAVATAPTDTAESRLLKLSDQYRLPRTLYCKMKEIIDSNRPSFTLSDTGTYEYWMDGPKYRILQMRDGPTKQMSDGDLRWNGELWQFLDVSGGWLDISKNGKRDSPQVSENPLFRPFSFLYTEDDSRSIIFPWQYFFSDAARSRFSSVIALNDSGAIAHFPGGKNFSGAEYSWQIEFLGDLPFLPSRILEVSSGVNLLTVELSYGQVKCDGGTAYLPDKVTLTLRDRRNNLLLVDKFVMTSVEADQPIAPETFTFNPELAKGVMDFDALAAQPAGRRSSTRSNPGIISFSPSLDDGRASSSGASTIAWRWLLVFIASVIAIAISIKYGIGFRRRF